MLDINKTAVENWPAGNDTIRFRRDAALLWRQVESVRPIADREGGDDMENLLAATTVPDGVGCSLTAFSGKGGLRGPTRSPPSLQQPLQRRLCSPPNPLGFVGDRRRQRPDRPVVIHFPKRKGGSLPHAVPVIP